jgi:hypothetical protein
MSNATEEDCASPIHKRRRAALPSRVRKRDVTEKGEERPPRRTILRSTTRVRIPKSPDALTVKARTAAERADFRLQCEHKEEVEKLGNCDCGCDIHPHGCYVFVLNAFLTLHGTGAYDKLVDVRTTRFHEAGWFKRIRTDMVLYIVHVSVGVIKFDYKVRELRVCRDAYRFFEALPQQTLTNIENDAAAGRVETKWTRKANASADGGVLDSTNDKTVNAVSWIENDIGDLAEEQPNVDPRDASDVDDVCRPVRHMDPELMACRTCIDGSKNTRGGAHPSGELCTGFCRYSPYCSAAREEGRDPVSTSTFKGLYPAIMKALCVNFRRNKGVSSDCRDCDVPAEIISRHPSRRTREEYNEAKSDQRFHRAVVRRLRGDERSSEQQSTRDQAAGNRDGLVHGIMDKGR